MMSSLFSSFDPLSTFSLSWLVFLVFSVSFSTVLVAPYPLASPLMAMRRGLSDQLGLALLTSQSLLSWVLPGLMFLALLNFSGLVPYVFTATAQMAISLSLAVLLWLSPVLYKLFFHPKSFISHLVPLGSPLGLSPFMVLVESVSLVIRPITLSVRLAANMVAGHLLLTLSGGLCGVSLIGLLGLSSQLILGGLELAVALVQAYVLFILVSLYISE